ncbi:MAG: glycosyltransferase family 9 protein [Bacteroidia bacterium]|nr:glycosyltransferase family 9 protein [Bacteroidia bacterium]
MRYQNILVIQTAFIGDAILASCLLEKLHASFPSASISILVRKGNEGIYERHPYLKETLVWDKKENKLKNLFSLLFRIRKNKYDCVINCHRYASSGFLTAFSGAKHSAGFKQNPFSFLFNTTVKHRFAKHLHEIHRYHELVNDFCDNTVYLPRLYPSSIDAERIAPLLQPPFVCMAPASVWFTKQLPKEKWLELLKLIPEEKKVYLLGAPGDASLCEDLISQSKRKNTIQLCGQLSLLQSALLMKHAEMNYVNDSAPLHLASSQNAPVRAFFLSTIPDFGFGPLSDNQKVIEVKDLNCRPCGLHGHKACPKSHFNCAFHINLNHSVI